MLFNCPRLLANFPAEKLRLVNRDRTRLLWDEHGGTFVLRAEGLEVLEAPELEGEAEIRLEVALPEAESLAGLMESFAGEHNLRLVQGPAAEVIAETPMLAAGHLPGKHLFIFCEAPRLTVRRTDSHTMEMLVTGVFKSRRVPCQETDLVIHLDMAAIGRLLAGLLAWNRKGA